MAHTRTTLTVSALAALILAGLAPEAEAGRRHRALWNQPTISSLKLGGYNPTAAGASGGWYAGLEMATRPSRTFEIGFATDYYYHGRYTDSDVDGAVQGPYDIPVDSSVNAYEASTHLLMLGVNGRLRLHGGSKGPVPFVEGGVAWNILHLRAAGAEGLVWDRSDDGVASDTFFGLGWHLGGGLEQPIDRRAALFAEAGYVRSRPTKTVTDGPDHIRYTANASGGYLRGGVRFRY